MKKGFIQHHSNGAGFTLVELLVVMAIIAIIMAVAVPNFLGARQRAGDAKKKSELNQVKNALRLYYNDYQKYPEDTNPSYTLATMKGCKADHVSQCPCDSSIDFAAGGAGCDIIYMKKLPIYSSGTVQYRQVDAGDNFCVKVTLDNASDPDILTSQQRCGNRTGSVPTYSGPCSGASGASTSDFAVCAD